MKKTILFWITALSLHSFDVFAQNKCNASNPSQVYEFPMLYLEMRTISVTEISIRARGKKICVLSAKAIERSDHTNQTDIFFNNNKLVCAQRGDRERLNAAKLKPTLYNVLGTYLGIEDGMIVLRDCVFQNV